MSVERNTPTTSGQLTVKTEPGVILTGYAGEVRNAEMNINVSGAQGVLFLGKLVEEAILLRSELEAAIR